MAPHRSETREIEIDLIDVGAQQIREMPDDDQIGELAESIASKGLLQAIGVTPKPDGRYQLRWGHRRLLAHQRLRRKKIRATIYEGDEASIKGIALVENLHRASMSLRDEIEAVQHLAEHEGKSVAQIAATLNKGREWVLNRLMAPNLPDYLREPLLDGDLSFNHIEVIAKVPDQGAQRYLVAMDLAQRWNLSQLKTIAECYMTPAPTEPPTNQGIPGVNPNRAAAPFLYTCEVCHEKGTLEEFTLVRVHKDGHACRANPNRSDHPGSPVDGLDRNGHDH